MSLAKNYMDTTNEMADTLICTMLELDNIPHQIFIKTANLVDKWRESTIELIYLMENATCLELDILLDKYESHLCRCLFYASNYVGDREEI